MIKNYFFLNRQIMEFSERLSGAIPVSVFSQEKDTLVIEFRKEDIIYLELCVNHSLPYFLIKTDFKRAKKNTLDFFPELKGQKLKSIMIAESDRVILFLFEDFGLFFLIRGKYTNIVLKENDSLRFFKKTDNDYEKTLKEELSRINFINHFNIPEKEEMAGISDPDIFRKKFPFIGREIFTEVKLKSDSNFDTDILLETIKKIDNSPLLLLTNNKSNSVDLTFEGFHFDKESETEKFNNINDTLSHYLSIKYYYENKADKLKIIERHLERELHKISNKLNNLQIVLERGSKEQYFRDMGNLLLINIDKIQNGAPEVKLENIYSGETVKIKLDPKLNAKKNIDRFFEKSKDEKVNFVKSQELYSKVSMERDRLVDIKNKITSDLSTDELDKIIKELKIKLKVAKQEESDISSKFKHYIINGKYDVYVGKDSTNNDLLTTRFAKQNDYWFHARSVSGSHVVLRVINIKEAIPKDVLKKAASLAAFHSKAKSAGVVPVAYTLKKFVYKRKGMPAGQVALSKEDVLLVKPEIPENCDFSQE